MQSTHRPQTTSTKGSPVIGILQTAFLGDLILSIGFVKEVRVQFPNAHIIFICRSGFKDLLKFVPEINETVEDQKNLKSFFKIINIPMDQLFILHRSLRSMLIHKFSIATSKIRFAEEPLDFRGVFRPRHSALHEIEKNMLLISEAKGFLPSFLAPKEGESFDFIFAPKSRWPTKEWPYFFDLAKTLFSSHKLAWIGVDEIPPGTPGVVLGSKLSWAQMLSLFATCKGVVCNDSSPLHFATAFRKPSLSFWGPTVLEFGYGPRNEVPNNVIFQNNDLSCRPCSIHGQEKCPLTHHQCMRSITVEKIKPKVLQWISSL